jgi:hypothetical protein
VDGIILVLSCQKHRETRLKQFKLNRDWYGRWKVIYVIGDLFLDADYKMEGNLMWLKCEDSYIHLLKKLVLAIKYTYQLYDIKEGILRSGDDLVYNENILEQFLAVKNKHDFIGRSPAKRGLPASEINDTLLTTTTIDPFMVDYYKLHPEDFTNPQHNLMGVDISKYRKRPRIAIGPAGILFYISNRSCKLLVNHLENIHYDIFHYDEKTQSYPYTIEDCAVSYILYTNYIGFIHIPYMFSEEPSDMAIGYHTNAYKYTEVVKIAYINFWEDPSNDTYFTKFIAENIGKVQMVGAKDNPDILIASVFGDIRNVVGIKAKCKLFFYGENLHRFPPYNNDELLHQVFDLVVGFRSNNGHIRFPLWLVYYPYYKYDETANLLKHIQSRYDENIKKTKPMFATCVSRHDMNGMRAKICDDVSVHGHVTYPSNFRNNAAPIGDTPEDKIQFISQSVYNICPENSAYEGYCTEKIFQALEAGTIPVYWGIDLPERGLINENKYCFGTDLHYPGEGPVFTANAPEIIRGYYETLANAIKEKLA